MKEKITEVQDYFKKKLLSGDFRITEVTQYRVTFLVDGEYEFNVWIGNWDIIESRRLDDGCFNFIHIDFSCEESEILHNALSVPVEKFRRNELLARKEKELNDLKKELGL